MGSQHPSPNVKTLCNFEPQIWPEIITSRDAESTCFKGSRTSCDVIIFGGFFGQVLAEKDHVTWWMLPVKKKKPKKGKHRFHMNFFEKFARTFPYFPVKRVRNRMEIVQKNLFRWTFSLGWIFRVDPQSCAKLAQLQTQIEEIINLTQKRVEKETFSLFCKETQKWLKSDFLNPKSHFWVTLRVKMSLFSHFSAPLSLFTKRESLVLVSLSQNNYFLIWDWSWASFPQPQRKQTPIPAAAF